MSPRDLLIALLRFAINGEKLDKEVFNNISEEKLSTLFKVSKKHDVAHLVAFALEKNGFRLDSQLWQSFLEEKATSLYRYEMIKADLEEIASCFDKEKIDYMPLKGAVIRRYYPEFWMRTSCDTDILVREEDLDRAKEALIKEYGYKADGGKGPHDISLYSPFGMHLELHFRLSEEIEGCDKILSRVWQYSNKENGNRYEQKNEFLLFYLISHMVRHFIDGGCGMRSVIDLYLLKRYLTIDETELNSLLAQAGFVTFYDAIVSLGEYWMGNAKEPCQTVKEMEKYILLGGVYGTEKQRAQAGQSLKGGKIKYVWSRIFLPYSKLSEIYPVIKRHKILTPFCQIARWLRAIFKNKRASREMRAVKSVSNSEIQRTKELLENLGLYALQG